MTRTFVDDLILMLGTWAEKIGLGLIILISIWDLVFMGARNLLHYSICWKGMIVIWLGVALIILGKHIDKELK